MNNAKPTDRETEPRPLGIGCTRETAKGHFRVTRAQNRPTAKPSHVHSVSKPTERLPPKGGNTSARFTSHHASEDGGPSFRPPIHPTYRLSSDTKKNDDQNLMVYIPGIPVTVTEQQKGVRVCHGKPHFYTKPEVLAARAHIARYINPKAPPILGPVELTIMYIFPKLKADTSPTDVVQRMYVRPDTDNLTKLIMDVLTAKKVYHDDGQVSDLIVYKRRGNSPSTLIMVDPAEETI